MIYRFTFFAVLLFTPAFFAKGQGTNLVPNPGFEERNNCAPSDGNIEDASPWFNPCVNEFFCPTPDVFHTCATSNTEPCPFPEIVNLDDWLFGVPTNAAGCESPYEGNGYAGALFFDKGVGPLYEYREYLGVRLTSALEAGVAYEVSFQVSLADRMTHAMWNLQVAFSSDSLYQEDESFIPFSPQLEGTVGSYITSKDGWTPMQWIYNAEGGEEFMYIGNFESNADADTLAVYFGDTEDYYNKSSYYYIDNVSVQSMVNSVLNSHAPDVSIYPNPADAQIVIEWNELFVTSVHMFDALGKLVVSQDVDRKRMIAIDISDLPSGMYFVKVVHGKDKSIIKKVVKR